MKLCILSKRKDEGMTAKPWTRKDLMELCRMNKIRGRSRMCKRDMILVLQSIPEMWSTVGMKQKHGG
jgi:hypothetical protein